MATWFHSPPPFPIPYSLSSSSRNREVPRGPRRGVLAMIAGAENLLGEPPEIVYQNQAQHNRNGPQFPRRQRSDGLKRLNEMGEVILVQTAVTMGHEFHGDRVYARQAAQRAGGDFGKQPIIAVRQIGVDLEQRFGNDVEVVEQPFGVGAEGLFPSVSRANLAVGAEQAAAVPNEALKQRPPGYDQRGPGMGGQMVGVDFQAVEAEYLRTNRVGFMSVGEKAAWSNPDGDDRGGFLGFR